MGNNLNCTCIKSSDEPEIGVSTNVIDSNSKLMNVKASHKETAIENPKEEDKSQRFVKSLQDRISHETDKSVTVNEITRDKFDKLIESFPHVRGILNTTASQLTDLEKESENNSTLGKIAPVQLSNTKTDEEEYFEGYVNENGTIEGFGTLLTQTGNFYKGNFKNNVFNGKGLFINKSGDYYLGNWENGESKGKGELVMKSGTKYTGDFVENKKHGTGTEIYNSGEMFEGEFSNNEKIKGKIYFKDGATYCGDVKNGKITGRGEYKWPDGRKYEGDICEGIIEGNGKTTYPDGSWYEGAYVDNKKNGKGTFSWVDGKTFTGQWVNNEPNGNGILTMGGVKYDVLFRYGKIISSKQMGDLEQQNITEFNKAKNVSDVQPMSALGAVNI